MGLRFESNFQLIAGLTPYLPDDSDVLTRWFRVHEWQVDDGFTSTLLMVLLNVETTVPLTTVGQTDYGWMRVLGMLNTAAKVWTTCYESKFIGSGPSTRQSTPRLVIIPCGNGITFTAGQGLMTKALGGSATVYRWWSCYVLKADAA